jgi:CRP-like cAMP-binding protein
MVYHISTRDEACSGDRVATEVIKEGAPGDAFFIVRSGEVSGSLRTPETVVGVGKCLKFKVLPY